MASILDSLSAGLSGIGRNLYIRPEQEFAGDASRQFGIADILSIAGQTLSPVAFEQEQRRRQQQAQMDAHKQQLILQGTLSAVENGSLPLEKAQAIFRQYRLPMDLLGGPNVAAQARMAEMQAARETDAIDAKIRGSLGGQASGTATIGDAPGGPIDTDNPVVSAPSVSVTAQDPLERQLRYADALINSGNKALVDRGLKLRKDVNDTLKLEADRKKAENDPGPQGTENERSIRALLSYQAKVEGGEKLTAAEERDAQARRSMLERKTLSVDPITGKPYFEQPIQIPSSITVGRQAAGASPGGGAPVNKLPSMEGGRKPVDADTEKKLTNMASAQSQAQNLSAIFDPKFAGFKSDVAGDLAQEAGRRLGGRYKDMALFWQQYEQWATDMRAEKFGLSLTGTEKANFDKYRAKASDDPDVARANIKRQLDIVNGAIDRQLSALEAAGYNIGQARALAGRAKDPSGRPVPPPADKPKVIDFKDLPKGRK